MRFFVALRPIAARRDSLPYRVGKFVARNRIGVAFAAIAILATALALASSIRQTQIARVEAGRSRSIQEFLVGLFQVARPADTPGGYRLTAKEMVDIGSQRLQAGSTDPTWSAELALVVGTVYAELGETRRAIELLEHQASCLLVSHDRSFVRAIGNRFWLIDGKKLVEVDGPEEFFTSARR